MNDIVQDKKAVQQLSLGRDQVGGGRTLGRQLPLLPVLGGLHLVSSWDSSRRSGSGSGGRMRVHVRTRRAAVHWIA